MSDSRWGRMSQTLAEAGIENKITERSYAGGVSRSIQVRINPTHILIVHDKWWTKNPDVWVGWSAYVENTRTALAVRDNGWKATKKRAEIRDFVLLIKAESERGEL